MTPMGCSERPNQDRLNATIDGLSDTRRVEKLLQFHTYVRAVGTVGGLSYAASFILTIVLHRPA